MTGLRPRRLLAFTVTAAVAWAITWLLLRAGMPVIVTLALLGAWTIADWLAERATRTWRTRRR